MTIFVGISHMQWFFCYANINITKQIYIYSVFQGGVIPTRMYQDAWNGPLQLHCYIIPNKFEKAKILIIIW